jgi:hypothetical protein
MVPVTLVLAWSVTMEQAQVESLIRQLGDERFAVRSAAHSRLEQILQSDRGCLHRPQVEKALTHKDLEIVRRAALLLEDYFNVQPTGYPVLPWIDMLPSGEANRQGIIDQTLGRARAVGCWGHNADWPDYRYATYLYTSELLRQGHSRKQVREILDRMVHQEREYREKRGMSLLAADGK